MVNYSTSLKNWGSTGSEYPNNYNYVEGEQPVDAWDNFFNSNVIDDIQHLINVTNNELLARDGTVDITADLSDDNGNVVWDYSAGHVPAGSVQPPTSVSDSGSVVVANPGDINFSGDLSVTDDTDGTVTVSVSTTTDSRTDVSNSGTTVVTETADINFGSGLAASDDTDGTASVDHGNTSSQGNVSAGAGAAITDVNLDNFGHVTSLGTTDFDSRYVLESGDTMSGNLDMDNRNILHVNDLRFTDGTDDIVAYQSTASKISFIPKTSNGPIAIEADLIRASDPAGSDFVGESGDTMGGNLGMNGNRLQDAAVIDFEDSDNDGVNWRVSEDGTSGHLTWIAISGGGVQMDLEHNGNLRIEGELTETAAL